MKKSLLIILSIILSCNFAFCWTDASNASSSSGSAGVSCWEEYSETFTPNTVSKMQAVLGDDVAITMVKADIKTATEYHPHYDYGSSTAFGNTGSGVNMEYPIAGVTPITKTIDSKMYYFKFNNPTVEYKTIYSSGQLYRGYIYSASGVPVFADGSNAGEFSGIGTYSFDNANEIPTSGTKASGSTFFSYKFTYCIASNHSGGGGGGGGAAGAAVNYIIKAD